MSGSAASGSDMKRKKRLFGVVRVDLLVVFLFVFLALILTSSFISRPVAWAVGAIIIGAVLFALSRRSE